MIDSTRPNVKLTPGTYATPESFTGTYTLSVYGPATADAFSISGSGGTLRVRDLDVTYALGCQGNGAKPTLDVARVSLTSDLSNGPLLGGGLCHVDLDQVVATGTTTNVSSIGIFEGSGGLGSSIVTVSRSKFVGGLSALRIADQSTLAVTNSIFIGQGASGAVDLTVTGNAAQSGTVSFSTFYNTILKCPTTGASVSFFDNIFLNEAPGAPTNTVSGTTCSHNYDLIKPQSVSVGASNLLGMDPRFVNGATGDFHLLVGSPAIDAADPAATLSTDYDGTPRPQGGRRDIGAFEYKP